MPTILAVNNDASQIAARLLAAAGDEPDRVKVVTGGKYKGFAVDDELAAAAGFVIDSDEADDLVETDEITVPPGEHAEVSTPTASTEPWVPWVEPVAAPVPAVVEQGQADEEPVNDQPVVEEPAPVEAVEALAPAEPVEEPKPVAEKPARTRSSRSK